MDRANIILLVEDEADQASLVQEALKQDCGQTRLIAVSSGEEAIRYLSGDPPYADRIENPPPTIMLLDLMMPGIGGLGVLQWLEKHPEIRRNMQTVVLTSMDASRHMEAAAALGATIYWVKSDWPLLRQRIKLLQATAEDTA